MKRVLVTNEEKEMIFNFYENTFLTQEEIAKKIGRHRTCVMKIIQKNYSKEFQKKRKNKTYSNAQSGENNPSFGKKRENSFHFTGEPYLDGKGYLLMLKPDWYTGRKKTKNIYVHHIIVCENLGLTEIPKGYCVHHCDGNKLNNDFSNLVLLSLGDHAALHKYLLSEGATTISKESTLKWVEARNKNINS